MLERALLNEPLKAISFHTTKSRTTLSKVLADTLSTLGFSCVMSRVQPITVAMALASRSLPGALEEQALSGLALRVAVPRPHVILGPALTAAENGVIELLVEGDSYARIAALRGTSPCTVANQIAGAYRKLGVSARPGLLIEIARRFLVSGASPWKEAPQASCAQLQYSVTPGRKALYRYALVAANA